MCGAVVFYAILCLMNLIYAVMYGAAAFEQVLIAWLLALAMSFIVIEPAEIGAAVLLAMDSANIWENGLEVAQPSQDPSATA